LAARICALGGFLRPFHVRLDDRQKPAASHLPQHHTASRELAHHGGLKSNRIVWQSAGKVAMREKKQPRISRMYADLLKSCHVERALLLGRASRNTPIQPKQSRGNRGPSTRSPK